MYGLHMDPDHNLTHQRRCPASSPAHHCCTNYWLQAMWGMPCNGGAQPAQRGGQASGIMCTQGKHASEQRVRALPRP